MNPFSPNNSDPLDELATHHDAEDRPATRVVSPEDRPEDLNALGANGVEPVPWIVPGILPKVGLVLVTGRAGCGKTSVVDSMIPALLTGEPWAGFDVAYQCRVLKLDEDQPSRAAAFSRLQRHAAPYGIQWPLAEPIPIEHPQPLAWFHGRDMNLSRPGDVERLTKWIEAHSPDVVFIDCLASVFRDLDQDKNFLVRQAIQPMLSLARGKERCLVFIHHMGKGEDWARGASTLKDAADVGIEVRREGANVTLYRRKARDWEEADSKVVTLSRTTAGPAAPIYMEAVGTNSGSLGTRLKLGIAALSTRPEGTKRSEVIGLWGHPESIDRSAALLKKEGLIENRGHRWHAKDATQAWLDDRLPCWKVKLQLHSGGESWEL